MSHSQSTESHTVESSSMYALRTVFYSLSWSVPVNLGRDLSTACLTLRVLKVTL